MNKLIYQEVSQFVNHSMEELNGKYVAALQKIKFSRLLQNNPYRLADKNITNAGNWVSDMVETLVSSNEEKLFGDFLESLAIFVAQKTCNGRKSVSQGVDLELENDGTLYIISIKSGLNWGNSSQHRALERDLQNCVRVYKQGNNSLNIQPVLGICYGKTRTSFLHGYMKVVGQNFWYLISEDKNLYTEIIEPIGYRAKEHNDAYLTQKNALINKYTQEFVSRFCDKKGNIQWIKVVEFNSKNLDLDK